MAEVIDNDQLPMPHDAGVLGGSPTHNAKKPPELAPQICGASSGGFLRYVASLGCVRGGGGDVAGAIDIDQLPLPHDAGVLGACWEACLERAQPRALDNDPPLRLQHANGTPTDLAEAVFDQGIPPSPLPGTHTCHDAFAGTLDTISREPAKASGQAGATGRGVGWVP